MAAESSRVPVTEGEIVYVAIDDDGGRPTEIRVTSTEPSRSRCTSLRMILEVVKVFTKGRA